MKSKVLDYTLRVYHPKTWKIIKEVAIPKKSWKALDVIIRLPSKVAYTSFVSLSFPVLKQDVKLVEAATKTKLDLKKNRYVLEVARYGRV